MIKKTDVLEHIKQHPGQTVDEIAFGFLTYRQALNNHVTRLWKGRKITRKGEEMVNGWGKKLTTYRYYVV